ncbi:cathepsin L-like [Sitodiplosis mosellana]|uniref:cathepsin L-like n=1 Tax=Sitodiplosis mosellana TaxID=263140 RepID=UPI0024445875|nr:cathepsin L-like [Sitodiplosis mosellana]
MKKTLVLICAWLVVVNTFTPEEKYAWVNYKALYNKVYEDKDEDLMHLSIFVRSRNLINMHNRLFKEGIVPYKMALNKFSDLTNTEFEKKTSPQNQEPTNPSDGTWPDTPVPNEKPASPIEITPIDEPVEPPSVGIPAD